MTTSVAPPGKPGITPRWTSSKKIGAGTAMTGDNNVWFTISHGIVNEVYFPIIDKANIRDMEFIVTDGSSFFSEEKKQTLHRYKTVEEGIPAFQITNTCMEGRYRIDKIVITDPRRDVLLQKVTFTPLSGALDNYHLYLLLAPHILNCGQGNTGWWGDYKGIPMLFAQRDWVTLACSPSIPFLQMTCGYVGVSDAWQDLHAHKILTRTFNHAADGNIALAAEID